ncbi:hypothetical protein [Marinomonas spartinae]|uniref:hypothetical protein n=1 Tax=Marinomonas spartinae TaxID=1792290 RepID=UPI0018F19552|nr:hypothetical protein [Marinomonas spartinae]MBJ7554049.1 hypothetical protein [Marinomonas spartinae]
MKVSEAVLIAFLSGVFSLSGNYYFHELDKKESLIKKRKEIIEKAGYLLGSSPKGVMDYTTSIIQAKVTTWGIDECAKRGVNCSFDEFNDSIQRSSSSFFELNAKFEELRAAIKANFCKASSAEVDSLSEGGMWWTGAKETQRKDLMNILLKEINC